MTWRCTAAMSSYCDTNKQPNLALYNYTVYYYTNYDNCLHTHSKHRQ